MVGGTLQIGNTVLTLGRKKGSGMQSSSAPTMQANPGVYAQTSSVDPVRQSAPVAPPAAGRPRPSIQMPNKPN